MSNILSPSEAKQARASAKLSQAKVASDLGINRTYLSLFEGGRYVFDDSTLIALRDYYEELGFDADCGISADCDEGLEQGYPGFAASKEVVVRGGVDIPASAEEAAAEEYLSARSTNMRRIREICSEKVERGLLGGIDRESLNSRLDEAVRLLAKNELITAQMHGRGYSAISADTGGDEALYVGYYLTDKVLDPKKVTEDDWWTW